MNQLLLKSHISKETGINAKTLDLVEGGASGAKKYIINKSDKSNRYMIKLSKIWFIRRNSNKLQEQMDFMKKINEHENVSISPIHKNPIEFEGTVGYVYNYIEGMPLKWHLIERKQIQPNQLGKFVAKFHTLTLKTTDARLQTPDWEALDFLLSKIKRGLMTKTDQVENILNMINEIKSEVSNKSVYHSITHGNIHAGNIIVEKNGNWKLIDMDDLRLDVLSRDFFSVWHNSFNNSNDWENLNDRFDNFILGYQSILNLNTTDKFMILGKLLTSLLFKIYTIQKPNENRIQSPKNKLSDCDDILKSIKNLRKSQEFGELLESYSNFTKSSKYIS